MDYRRNAYVLERRLNEIKSASPLNVWILASAFVARAGEKEFSLQRKYKDYFSHREWYRIPPDKMNELINDVMVMA